MFREIDPDRIDRVRGMDVTLVTTANTDDEGHALLRHLGFPFKRTDCGEEVTDRQAARRPKFKVRAYTAASGAAGRTRSIASSGLCRICLREMAHRGELPGITKSSW